MKFGSMGVENTFRLGLGLAIGLLGLGPIEKVNLTFLDRDFLG